MSENSFNIINARVTFKNIPLHKIEKYSFKDKNVACDSFKKILDVSECIIIQNSFRVEVFMVVNLDKGDIPDARRSEGKILTITKIQETWASLTELVKHDLDHFDQTLEMYKNTDVCLHLLRLASGLESLVIGRIEVVDEIKESIANAKLNKFSGRVLNKLFDSSLRIANKIRDSTGIGEEITSIGDIAIKTAEEKTGIEGKHVLLIGTGETAAVVSKSLNKKNYPFEVTSRTIERATGFSKLFGGTPINFEDVISEFAKFDIIIVAITADYFLINFEKIKRVMQNKKTGTLILDISDPRAVDEKVATLPGIKLMFLDQISELYNESVKVTQGKVPSVEKLISKELPILEATMKNLKPEPLVEDVFTSIDSLRKQELTKALASLGETDEKKIKIIEELTKTVVERIVSIPSGNSKKATEQETP